MNPKKIEEATGHKARHAAGDYGDAFQTLLRQAKGELDIIEKEMAQGPKLKHNAELRAMLAWMQAKVADTERLIMPTQH